MENNENEEKSEEKNQLEDQINKFNFIINDGDSFYANEISITFGPTQFILDFKNISPRVDVRCEDDSRIFVLKHNPVLLEPFQVKNFAKVLNDAIAKFESEFGEIKIPESIKKIENEVKKIQKEKSHSHDVPSYFG